MCLQESITTLGTNHILGIFLVSSGDYTYSDRVPKLSATICHFTPKFQSASSSLRNEMLPISSWTSDFQTDTQDFIFEKWCFIRAPPPQHTHLQSDAIPLTRENEKWACGHFSQDFRFTNQQLFTSGLPLITTRTSENVSLAISFK